MGENRNRRNKRRSRNSLGNRMALIGITVVVGSLAVVVHIGGTSLRERDLEYQAREQALEKTLAKEEARAAELEEYRVYVQTKQYIEKVAKEKLGLVKRMRSFLKRMNPTDVHGGSSERLVCRIICKMTVDECLAQISADDVVNF